MNPRALGTQHFPFFARTSKGTGFVNTLSENNGAIFFSDTCGSSTTICKDSGVPLVVGAPGGGALGGGVLGGGALAHFYLMHIWALLDFFLFLHPALPRVGCPTYDVNS